MRKGEKRRAGGALKKFLCPLCSITGDITMVHKGRARPEPSFEAVVGGVVSSVLSLFPVNYPLRSLASRSCLALKGFFAGLSAL